MHESLISKFGIVFIFIQISNTFENLDMEKIYKDLEILSLYIYIYGEKFSN